MVSLESTGTTKERQVRAQVMDPMAVGCSGEEDVGEWKRGGKWDPKDPKRDVGEMTGWILDLCAN
jgi:hypothetical protein